MIFVGSMAAASKALLVGRYRVHDEIAAGGMATVHLGRLLGDAGFSRTVAIKRLHPFHAQAPDVVAMFTDEARIASRIHHPNVVTTLDVVSENGEVFLVMEYVHGEPLSRMIINASKRKQLIPPRIVVAVLSSVLHGLHAAHEAKDSLGRPLGVVHRDVSPQNVMVGIDGVARVLDFGVARAAGRAHITTDGSVKGKLGYMSPEQLRGEELDRRSDVYAAGVVLWEALTCKRLYGGSKDAAPMRYADGAVEPPSKRVPDLPQSFDEITLRAMRWKPEERFSTAREMAEALEATGAIASPAEVADWVEDLAGETLAERGRLLEALETEERRSSLHIERPGAAEAEALLDEVTIPKHQPAPIADGTRRMSPAELLAAATPARAPALTPAPAPASRPQMGTIPMAEPVEPLQAAVEPPIEPPHPFEQTGELTILVERKRPVVVKPISPARPWWHTVLLGIALIALTAAFAVVLSYLI